MRDRIQVVPREDVALVLRVVRARFLGLDPATSNAIVIALEGLKWLAGEDSVTDRPLLEAEAAWWDEVERINQGDVHA